MTALQAPPHGGAYRLIALNPTLRKRPWKPEIKARYEQLVTSLPESGYTEAKTNSLNSNKNDGIQAHNSSMVVRPHCRPLAQLPEQLTLNQLAILGDLRI